MINILHLSDLHYSSTREHEHLILLNAINSDLEKIKVQDEVSIDLILFTGDLVKDGSEKNEFQQAYRKFILPIANANNLNKDMILFCPGNHDINKDEIDEFTEIGLSTSLSTREKTNKIINEIVLKGKYTERLDNYNDFVTDIDNKNCSHANNLFRTYKYYISGLKIGIACLNTVWRATGGKDNIDHGKLLLSERQIDLSVEQLADCEIKVAIMHHSLEWLKPFEAYYVKNRLFSEFNIVSYGHNHDPDSVFIDSSKGTIVQSNAGSIYQGRDFYNGYNIISFSGKSLKGYIYFRSYFDRRRQFDAATDICENGKQEISIASTGSNNNIVQKNEIPDLNQSIHDYANSSLLSYTIVDTYAPKSLIDIFVPPNLSLTPEATKEFQISSTKDTGESPKKTSIQDIIDSSDNQLIVGGKESGKTTILNYLAIELLNKHLRDNKSKIPIRIDFNYIHHGKAVKSVINSIVYENDFFNNATNVTSALDSSKCILLIDNINFDDESKVKKLSKFISTFPNNRYIFSCTETLDQSIKVGKRKIFGLTANTVYIQQFSLNQIRQLTTNWLTNSPLADKAYNLSESITKCLDSLNIPRSPVTISIFLGIYEKQNDFVLSNKASLIEKFLELILGKFTTLETAYKDIDHKDKEDFLSRLAEQMSEDASTCIQSNHELEKFTIEYFSKRGLKVSITPFLNFFFKSGILTNNKSQVKFKYLCFYDFFIAKRMSNDKSFYEKVISEENLPNYINSIDYLSGIQRNNHALILELSTRIKSMILDDEINHISDSLFDEYSNSLLSLDINDSRKLFNLNTSLSQEEKDDIIDINCDKETIQEIKKIETKKSNAERKLSTILAHNITLSRLLRNCDHIDDLKFRKYHLGECLLYWEIILKNILSNSIDKTIQQPEITEDDKNHIIHFLLVCVSLVVQHLIYDNLGSEKLELLIKDNITEEKANYTILYLYTYLFTDIKQANDTSLVEIFIKSAPKFFLELSLFKLHFYYLFLYNNKSTLSKLENLIADVHIQKNQSLKKSSAENKIRTSQIKASIKNKLQSELAIRKSTVKKTE